MRKYQVLVLLFLGFLVSCKQDTPTPKELTIPEISPDALAAVPSWAKNAVWYQIFVERFRNGDTANDPTLADIQGAYPPVQPTNWKPTPWAHDWYEQEDWAKALNKGFYETVYLRRYGGDLQGILEKLDELQDLGVNALYLNPVNDAPSLHKYDARNYHHIDRNFGPNPAADRKQMQQENPNDPATWQWTEADKLFLTLIQEAHKRNMKIIMDYSWNHTGTTFWAFQDVLKNQENSPYADWYYINSFDNPATPDSNEFSYEGWANIKDLPELKKVSVENREWGKPYEGNLYAPIKQHILQVTKRWLDPNGDGNPNDGVDGFRLDVAEQIPLGFWRDYRKFVKGINSEALLVGEIWWETWPTTLADPSPYLNNMFDAVMNYRWSKNARDYLLHGNGKEFVTNLDAMNTTIPLKNQQVMMNVFSTHDTPRMVSSLFNANPYKQNATPRNNPAYRYTKPDKNAYELLKVLLAHQFTTIGAPHIWNGDEVGMWGADDPDNRKPMLWQDLTFSPEKTMPSGESKSPDSVFVDTSLRDFYKQLIQLRKNHPSLFVEGTQEMLAQTENGLLIYRRTFGDEMAVIFLNTANTIFPLTGNVAGNITTAMTFKNPLQPDEIFSVNPEMPNLNFQLSARSFKILIKE